MRSCAYCSHDNADHLSYCATCGRRMPDGDGAAAVRAGSPPPLVAQPGARAAEATSLATPTRIEPSAFAPTVAVTGPAHAPDVTPDAAPRQRGPATRGIDAVSYVFHHVRGRFAADDRRRALAEERAGARRLLEGALVDLGKTVLVEPGRAPTLASLIETATDARTRRATATADLAAAEEFRATEDLRLGLQQATAESELTACEVGAARLDDGLRALDEQRRAIETASERLVREPNATDVAQIDAARAALDTRRAHVAAEVAIVRERGAALRASTMAARAKVDHAVAARRQSEASVAAAIVGHTRERSDAEARLREVTIEIGRGAYERRLALADLEPRYARVERLEQTIAETTRQIESVQQLISSTDVPKLAAGVGLLTGLLGVLGVGLWFLLHVR